MGRPFEIGVGPKITIVFIDVRVENVAKIGLRSPFLGIKRSI
jgi:hypothetical protein